MKRWPKDDRADARIVAERVAEALTVWPCPWCGKPAPGWIFERYENGYMQRSRPMKPGPGIEYHCYEAMD